MSSTYDAYTKYNTLQEIGFIAGSEMDLEFELFDEKGNPIDLTSSSGRWFLSPYGQTEINIAELEMITVIKEVNDSIKHYLAVSLPKSLTINLSGLFTQQIEIENHFGKIFRPVKGTVIIHPAIQSSMG